MSNHHPTGKDRQKIPDVAEQLRIRASLNMKKADLFPRCRGKANYRVKKFVKAGDESHSEKNHICEECRCRYVAGSHTDHYGVGYCYNHESTTGMTKTNMQAMVACQKTAIQQGYPDAVYKYKTNDVWIDEIRAKAEESGGATDLREELALLRSKSQELITKFEDGKEKLTEGHDKDGCVRTMTDATYYKLMATLMTSVGKLTQANLAVTEQDYIHVDQVNIWFAQVIRLIQQEVEAEHPEVFDKLIDGIKLIPTMTKGRIK